MGWAVYNTIPPTPPKKTQPNQNKTNQNKKHQPNALYHQHHWSKTPKHTTQQNLNRSHVPGMDAASSTSFISKCMKTQLCISSLLKKVQWGCVNAANLALQCVLERDKLLVSWFFFYIYISQMSAPSRGKALSVDFFSLCCYLQHKRSTSKLGDTDQALDCTFNKLDIEILFSWLAVSHQ